MNIKRAYKTELKPNSSQGRALANHCGAARFAYNWGLARKTESYELTGKSPSALDLHRELNALKKTDLPWLYEVSKCAPQEALRDLDRAYANFFRRVELKKNRKHRGKVGFPRFKSRRKGLGSFRLTGSIQAEEGRVKLPRLGWIRLKEKGYLPSERESIHVLSATVSERAGRWFVSLQVEEERREPEPASGSPAGVDLGVKTLAAVSYGEDEHVHYENPKALYSGAKKLWRLQKKFCRQEKGSNRRQATKRRIARQHYRIACVRSDAIHKATSHLVAKAKPPTLRPSIVGIEDLNVSGMMKNRRLARRRVHAGVPQATGVQVRLVRHRDSRHPALRGDLQAVLKVRVDKAGPGALGAHVYLRALRSCGGQGRQRRGEHPIARREFHGEDKRTWRRRRTRWLKRADSREASIRRSGIECHILKNGCRTHDGVTAPVRSPSQDVSLPRTPKG
jgi:putative transposase